MPYSGNGQQKGWRLMLHAQAENTPQPVIAELQIEVMPIPEEDLSAIKGIFGIDTFFATETIAYQEGASF